MKKTAFTILGWIISIGLLASLAFKLDLQTLWAGFTRASWGWLLAAAAVNGIVIALKTLRWKMLMQPSAPLTFWRTFKATVIGMAGNNVLPARGGDVAKIYLMSKWANATKTALTSVAGLDKLFDGLSIVLLFGFLSLHSTFPVWVQRGTTMVSIIIAVSLAICVLLLLHHRRTRTDEPEEMGVFSRIARKFGSGMGALASKKIVLVTLANSIAISLLQVATIWCCQLAFGIHAAIWVPALVFVAINLALVVPSAPSGVGPFEVAAVLAYAWLHVGKETAFDIAIMYHAVQFFPITISGMVFYLTRNQIGGTNER